MAGGMKVKKSVKAPDMPAWKKEAIKKTQGKPAFIGSFCVGGGKSDHSFNRELRHQAKHPNDIQSAEHYCGTPRRASLTYCSHCGQGFQSVNQLDATLEGNLVVYSCRKCRDAARNGKKSPVSHYPGIRVEIPTEFRKTLPAAHDEARKARMGLESEGREARKWANRDEERQLGAMRQLHSECCGADHLHIPCPY